MATTLIDRTNRTEPTPKAADAAGVSCHAGKEELTKAAAAAGQPVGEFQPAPDETGRQR